MEDLMDIMALVGAIALVVILLMAPWYGEGVGAGAALFVAVVADMTGLLMYFYGNELGSYFTIGIIGFALVYGAYALWVWWYNEY